MEKASRLNPSRAVCLAWEEIRHTLSEFRRQERLRLKKHKSVRDIHKARKAYMTNLLKGHA